MTNLHSIAALAWAGSAWPRRLPLPRAARRRGEPRRDRGLGRSPRSAGERRLSRRLGRDRGRRGFHRPLRAGLASSAGVISGAEINNRPITRPGEVLEAVPGLIVTQHSRGGQGQPVLPARLQPRPRHRHRHPRRRHAGEHAHPRPRPGLRRPQLPDPRTRRRRRIPQGAVLRPRRRLRLGRLGADRLPRHGRAQPRADLDRQLRLQAGADHRLGAARAGQPAGRRRGPGLRRPLGRRRTACARSTASPATARARRSTGSRSPAWPIPAAGPRPTRSPCARSRAA